MDAVRVSNGLVDVVLLNVEEAPDGFILVESDTVYAGFAYSGGTFAPPAAPATPVSYRISKADIWRRVTEDEAETLQAILSSVSIRLQGIFAGAVYLETGDPDFQMLQAAIVSALGSPRAAAVLAPSVI